MSHLSRKEFLKKSVFASAALPFATGLLPNAGRAALRVPNAHPTASDDSFWTEVRQYFQLDTEVVNLNNGAVGSQPLAVQQAHIDMYRKSNLAPSHFMWKEVDGQREELRETLAALMDCEAEELAINRNTTEGLNTLIFGLELKPGDEVVVSDFDYPYALNAWKQRAKRDGIVIREVKLSLPIEDENSVIESYRAAITSKTKVVHLTHIINWTGQLLPVKDITEMAQNAGCQVAVDAAHSLAQIPVSFHDIGCDFMATSLHKWLGAPFGTGALLIKKNKTQNVWAAPSAWKPNSADIRKFEVLGTRSFPAEMAALDAISFHQKLGTQRVHERLQFLKMYWTNKVKDFGKLRFQTSLHPNYSAAMATFSIDGMEAAEIAEALFETDKLHVGTIAWNGLNGVRISPHIYTSLEELDRLVLSIQKLAG